MISVSVFASTAHTPLARTTSSGATTGTATVKRASAASFVIATGTCEFRGLNDQNRVVTLSLLTDPVDIANFNDLVASVGTTSPLNDPAAPTAMIGPNHQVLAVTDRGIYGVVTLVNDSTPQEQYALSAAVLATWLAMG